MRCARANRFGSKFLNSTNLKNRNLFKNLVSEHPEYLEIAIKDNHFHDFLNSHGTKLTNIINEVIDFKIDEGKILTFHREFLHSDDDIMGWQTSVDFTCKSLKDRKWQIIKIHTIYNGTINPPVDKLNAKGELLWLADNTLHLTDTPLRVGGALHHLSEFLDGLNLSNNRFLNRSVNYTANKNSLSIVLNDLKLNIDLIINFEAGNSVPIYQSDFWRNKGYSL
jgi:hypothetical protein